MPSIIEPSQINLASRLKCVEGQMAADLGGELAILNIETGVYYGLNEVGARIWSLLKEGRGVGEIRDRIMEEYAVDASVCERDLLRLLDELYRHQLIEIDHGPDNQI